jgi:UDPglucose 6-dehydrogenase
VKLEILPAVERVNASQKRVLVEKLVRRFGEDLSGMRIAVWGLAFKPGTDDMREAPSREVIAGLLARGARVSAYDPAAMDEAKRVFGDEPRVVYADSPMHAVEGTDALVIVTEWKEFRSPDFDAIRAALKTPVIFDGRNLYEPADVARAGLEYFPIGRRG